MYVYTHTQTSAIEYVISHQGEFLYFPLKLHLFIYNMGNHLFLS